LGIDKKGFNMTITDWIPLVASVVAILTSIVGLLFQNRQLKQQEKEFVEKYTSHESRMRGWLDGLNEPPEPLSDVDHADTGLPYQAGAPIRNPELFYGRQEQLSSVINCVNGRQMASMSILGARKSGKTSFFHYLKHVFNPEQFPRIVPVFLDSQSVISGDKNFYSYMLREASMALDARSKANARPPDIPKEVDFEILSTFLERSSKKQWRFIFLLDEFERLVRLPQISGDDLFSSLRSLILKGNVSWITASFRAVYMPGTTTSPFINIIQETCHLGPLSSADARLLVSEPAARAGHPFEREDVGLILELAGRMPFMLQKAALLLYKAHRSGTTGQSARTHLANAFKLESKTHFESQFSILSPEERQALFLLSLDRDSVDRSQIPESLEQYGFIEDGENGFQVLGRTFEEYLYQKAKEAQTTAH